MIIAVLSSYGGVKYMRICESQGWLRSLAEKNGQAGDLTCGAGTMVLVCLGRSFQPLICCRVTKDSRMHPCRCQRHAPHSVPQSCWAVADFDHFEPRPPAVHDEFINWMVETHTCRL